jgi:hypothetical protein
MRPASLAFLLLVAATPAFAGTDPGPDSTAATEIQLGDDAAPPPPAPEDFRVQAVEGFLADRQRASIARTHTGVGASHATGPQGATDEELYGPKGSHLIAFDFAPEAAESEGSTHFRVPVYLLFADEDGAVVESRDETLDFSETDGTWACAARRTSAQMSWMDDGVLDAAESLGVSEELTEAERHLHDWTVGRKESLAYSVADIAKENGGRVVVTCLRYTAEFGRRGFDVTSTPLVLSREQGVFRFESN